MFEFLIGVALAILVAIFGAITNFDRDRSFYSTVLIVIASYYVLFSFIAIEAIAIEILIALIFCILAVFGATKWPLLLGLSIIFHGIFDYAHDSFIENSGVPVWWPAFCAGVDIALGIWVVYLSEVKKIYAVNKENT